MHVEFFHFQEVVILLISAVLSTVIFNKLNISSVLGYFLSGAIIGQYGLGLVGNSSVMDYTAQFGVVFLLFLIGLELTLQRLISMRLYVFGFGTLQLLITSFVIWLIVHKLGMQSEASIVIGLGAAMSSTVIVIQFLKEKGLQISQVGRLSISVLLLQDFAVVPMIMLVQLLTSFHGGGHGNSSSEFMWIIGMALLRAFLVLVAIFIVGRVIIKPVFDAISELGSDEIFISSVLLIILGSAFATETFGLSMALGAFIAGLLMAETEYHKEVERVVLPFKNLLLGLFFMTVGMSTNYKTLVQNFWIIAGGALAIIFIKTVIVHVLCRLFKFKRAPSIQSALLLSQVGEFAFVIFKLASQGKIMSSDIAEILMIITTVTMALTPLLSKLGELIDDGNGGKNLSTESSLSSEIHALANHVILVGFGRCGQSVAQVLAEESQQYIALDINKDLIIQKKASGFPVYFGNPTKPEVLISAGCNTASSIIITISNDISIKKIISFVSEHFPNLTIITRAEDSHLAKVYHSLGAHLVIPEKQELGVSLGISALNVAGLSLSASKLVADRLRRSFRSGDL